MAERLAVVLRGRARRDIEEAVDGFPYLVFYVEQPGHLDVWRVLHARRDIPSWLRDPETPVAGDEGA